VAQAKLATMLKLRWQAVRLIPKLCKHEGTFAMQIHATSRPCLSGRLAAVLFAWLTLWSFPAQAQQCTANFDFTDPGSPRYLSTRGSLPNPALPGYATANVYGYIRNGRPTRLYVNYDPDVNGPNNLRLFQLDFNSSYDFPTPGYRCSVTSTGIKLSFSGVPDTREYFSGESTYSIGLTNVDVYLDRNSLGRIVIRYTHRNFNRADATPPRPTNGYIINAVPQAPARLNYMQR
jgi:hypothetical protein